MQIIKPYGRSHAERDPSGAAKRVLRPRLDPDKGLDPAQQRTIEKFAQSHDELVIAQWISAIDKIARKPAGKNDGPTKEQRAFRKRLGNAAWAVLEVEEKKPLPGMSDPKRKEHLKKLWQAKIHPYGKNKYEPKKDKKGKELPPPPVKGRWYETFAGDADVKDANAKEIAEKIHEHLYSAEYRIGTDDVKSKGRILARAESIANNVLKPRKPGARAYAGGEGAGWTEEDRETYKRAGDVAKKISQAAQQREKGEDQAGTRRVTVSIAGAALFEHYGRVFAGDDGNLVLPGKINAKEKDIKEGNEVKDKERWERWTRLLKLHMAVKDCYSRILKHHKKDLKEHKERRRKVSALLPKTMDELFALVDRKGANRDLNALVRLGKIIHYESAAGEDTPADVLGNWPTDVTNSSFWTSDGQAKIKRNEAFVRVWRHILALASRTLTDWADPAGKKIQSDILLKIDLATGGVFDSENYGRKLDLLYGSRADFFKDAGNDTFQKNVLRLALEGTAQLRHNSFHFKGLGRFANALAASGLVVDEQVIAAIQKLWETDVRERSARLLQTMRGAHFEFFFNEQQNRKLFEALSHTEPAAIPLPRFSRILLRASEAWKGKDRLGLPEPANRADLEKPARLCQYTALKLLYERAFRTWLQGREAAILNGFIERAVERGTVAARALNAKGDEDRAEMIVARTAGSAASPMARICRPSFSTFLPQPRARCGCSGATRAIRIRRASRRTISKS